MRITLRASLCGIALLAAAGAAQAQQTKPTTKPKQAKPTLTVTVKEVSGTAQRLLAGKGEKWTALKAGDKLDEMTIIRTGFRTRVVLAFADNSVVTIDRATKMGIRQFRKDGKVTRTKLGLKYGSLRATVEKARGPNDFRVSTPVATLAVTGSDGITRFSGDFGFEMNCRSGGWNVKKGLKGLNLNGVEATNNDLLTPIEMAKKCRTPVVGDAYGGLTPKEVQYMRNYSGATGFTPGGATRQIIKRPLPPPPLVKPKPIITPRQQVHVECLDEELGT